MNSNDEAVEYYERHDGIMTQQILNEISQSPDIMRIMKKSSQIMWSATGRERFKFDIRNLDPEQALLAAYGYYGK